MGHATLVPPHTTSSIQNGLASDYHKITTTPTNVSANITSKRAKNFNKNLNPYKSTLELKKLTNILDKNKEKEKN